MSSEEILRMSLTLDERHVAALEMLCGRAAIAFGHLEEALRDYRTQMAAVVQTCEAADGETADQDGAQVVSRTVTDGVRVQEG